MFRLCCLSLLAVGALSQNLGGPIVDTPLGRAVGWERLSRDGRVYQAWTGIPYAQPPVGQLRFKAPKPAQKWSGVLNATGDAPMCFQHSLGGLSSEDCLYLSVYRPKNGVQKMPVLVHVHGGAFQVGSMGPRESADYLMDEDVVLVQIQYRLNGIGFMSLGDKVMPGNFGIKDQVLALKWVQQNIAVFGGDPNSVTVIGESAGAASTHFLLKTPAADGLVHRALSNSGTVNPFWSLLRADIVRNATLNVAEKVGCGTSGSNQEIFECLQKANGSALLEAMGSARTSGKKLDIVAIKPDGSAIILDVQVVNGSMDMEQTWRDKTGTNWERNKDWISEERSMRAKRELSVPYRCHVTGWRAVIGWLDIFALIVPAAWSFLVLHLKFVPCIEPKDAEDAVATEDISMRPVNKPWITSNTNGEYSLFKNMPTPQDIVEYHQDLNGYLEKFIDDFLETPDSFRTSEGAQLLKNHYFPVMEPIENFTVEIAEVTADSYFPYASLYNLLMHEGPKWYFYFEYVGEQSKIRNNTVAGHDEQRFYYFNLGGISPKETPEDYQVSKRMIKYLVNFAYYDDPTPPGSPMKWDQFTGHEILRIANSQSDVMADGSVIQKLLNILNVWSYVIGWES